MRYLITTLLLISSLYALTLQKGMSIVGMTATEILSEGRFRSDIDIIYGTVNGTWTSFNPNKKMAFNGLKELKRDQAYIVVVSRVMNLANATLGIGTQIKCPKLDAGVNITPMYTANFANGINDINGSKIKSMFSTKDNSYISYNPDVPLPLNSLQRTTNGRFYVIDVDNDNVEACGAKTSIDTGSSNPSSFTFRSQFNVPRDTFAISNEVLIDTGKDLSRAYVDDGEIIVNGDLNNSYSEQLIKSGDRIQIKLRSSNEYNGTKISTLYYNGTESTFTVTTLPTAKILPFSFQPQVSVPRNTSIVSNEVLVSVGLEPSRAYVDKGVIIKNGDINNSSSEQIIQRGDKIQIELISSSDYNTTSTATLFYADAQTTFETRTLLSSEAKLNFNEVNGASISFPIVSNEVLVTFGNSLTEAVIDNGLLVKNGDFLSASTSQFIRLGDKIQIQLNSSSEYNTTVTSKVLYLGESSEFNVTTVEFADLIPDDFVFDEIATNPERTVISNQVDISGISQGLSANIDILFGASDATIIQNGVDTLSRTVNVYAGDKLNLKVAVGSEPAIVKLSVGEKSSNFDITVSDVIDSTPDKFLLSRKDNLDPNIEVFSDEVIISGLGAFIKTYAAGLNANVYVNGASTGNYVLVQNDDIVKLGMKTPAQLGTPRVGQLYIGGEMSDFNITTTSTNPDQDDNPTNFDIAPALNVDVSTFVTSEEIVVLGINVLATVTLDKGLLIVNGVEIPTNKTSVVEFDKIQIKARSSDSYVDEVVSNLTIGPVTKAFKIVTKEQPVNILIENQRYRKDQNITLPFASAPAAVSWEIVNGRLPAGLIFDSNKRVIEGTTSKESNISTYTIKATIVNGESAQVKRTIEIGDYISRVNQTPDVDGGVDFDDTWYKNSKTLGVPIYFSRLFTSGIIQVNSILNWLDIEPERMTFDDARAYCENLEFGGFNNWRLPTIYELQTINGHNIEFDNIGEGFMWSSTPSAEKQDWYWYVDFGNGGKSYIINKTNKAFVKCVVGAQ